METNVETNSLPVGPNFKRTDLKAGLEIRFPYQDQQFTGTIEGFYILNGQEAVLINGTAYAWSGFQLKPVYEIIGARSEAKPQVEDTPVKKIKIRKPKITGKPDFKLIKKRK